MENVTWGAVPTQRKKKEELFSTPVLTMSELAGKGTGRKFTFNPSAQEFLDLKGEENIMFGYSTIDNAVYLKIAKEGNLKLTKTCTFNDKKTFEAITKRLGLSNNNENHFDIIDKGSYFELILKNEKSLIEECVDEDMGLVEEENNTKPSKKTSFEEVADKVFSKLEEEEEVFSGMTASNVFSASGSDLDEDEEGDWK